MSHYACRVQVPACPTPSVPPTSAMAKSPAWSDETGAHSLWWCVTSSICRFLLLTQPPLLSLTQPLVDAFPQLCSVDH